MTSVVIVAAGRGTRMGPDVDKLFLEVNSRPLVAHTWQRFDACDAIDEIVLVVRAGMEQTFVELAEKYGFKTPHRIVTGGKERQDSVWNGLQAIDPQVEIVAIQDGARPCCPEELIRATLEAAREYGAAVAAQRVSDTIKEADGEGFIARTVDRSRLWSVQTPQTFRVEVIRRALAAVRERGFMVTDDTAACEVIGYRVKLVESRWANPKATGPADLHYIEELLRAQSDPPGAV